MALGHPVPVTLLAAVFLDLFPLFHFSVGLIKSDYVHFLPKGPCHEQKPPCYYPALSQSDKQYVEPTALRHMSA